MRQKYRLAAFLIWAVALTSCSIVTDFSECENNTDCTAKYGAGNTCEDGVCRAGNTAELLGGSCTQSSGDITASNSLNFGVIMPLTDADESQFGIPLVNAMKLAQADINRIGGVNGRKIGLIICDSLVSTEGAVAAAEHLTSKAKVPVIIGSDTSGQTIEIATQVAIPASTVVISPSATAAAISTLSDNNLVWRTCASDNTQGEALAAYVTDLVEHQLGKRFDDITMWVLGPEENPYASGLLETLASLLSGSFVTSPRFIARSYPPSWEDWFVSSTELLARPDVVVLLGSAESWDLAEEIDRRFPGAIRYVGADAAKIADVAAATTPELEGRFSGVAPQNVGDPDYSPYVNFSTKYRAAYEVNPDELQFVAHAYDAVMIAALGAAAGGITGPEIAAGMTKLSDADGVKVSGNGDALSAGLQRLVAGESVDYEGASGALDLDANGEPPTNPISLWCFDELSVPEVGVVYSNGKFNAMSCVDTGTNDGEDMGTDAGADASDAGSDAEDAEQD